MTVNGTMVFEKLGDGRSMDRWTVHAMKTSRRLGQVFCMMDEFIFLSDAGTPLAPAQLREIADFTERKTVARQLEKKKRRRAR